MVIVMETDSGKVIAEENSRGYDDEVLNAGWAEVPQVEPRLQEAAVARRERDTDVEGYLARLYAAQGMVGR